MYLNERNADYVANACAYFIKNYCLSHEDCNDCPFNYLDSNGFGRCSLLQHTPNNWEVEK